MALKTCSNIGANSMPIPFIIGLINKILRREIVKYYSLF
jgi:hypothetical protein